MPLSNTIIICPEAHSEQQNQSTPSALFVQEFIKHTPNSTIALALETCGDAHCYIDGSDQTLSDILAKYMSGTISAPEEQLLQQVTGYYMPIIESAKKSGTNVIFADSTTAGHAYSSTQYTYNQSTEKFDRQDIGSGARDSLFAERKAILATIKQEGEDELSKLSSEKQKLYHDYLKMSNSRFFASKKRKPSNH